jgi:hypothetical protein
MTNPAGNNARQDAAMIDRLLADMSAHDTSPSDDLMARVLGDAAIVQEQLAAVPTRKPVSMWVQFGQLIGGWPALGGLAAAGVAGLWIGVAPPANLETFAAEMIGNTETVDLFGTEIDLIFGGEIDG